MDYSLQNNFFYLKYGSFINYYIYIDSHVRNKEYRFSLKLLNNRLYIFIKNKIFQKNDSFKIKIIKNEKSNIDNDNKDNNGDSNIINNNKLSSCILILQNIRDSPFYIEDISKLHYIEFNKNKNNDISKISDISINNIDDPIFDIYYYITNNHFLDNNCLHDNNFIKMHWYYTGQYHPQLYFKQILYKYRNLILSLKYPRICYDGIHKNNTLLFIDDRYDPSFLYIASLFLYSVDESWNIRIYTIGECKGEYEADFEKLGISGCISILPNKFECIGDYSELLKSSDFWNGFPEENCLLFQYDSFCCGKFKEEFFSHNYLGALWDHQPCRVNNCRIGNGGTSFRKRSIMATICEKYGGLGGDIAEDIFFAIFLKEDGLLGDAEKKAEDFSFECIFSGKSVYGHQIYQSIARHNLDGFIYNKLTKMLEYN
jgi:hypothetical protein